jgi:hypothetical protein
MFVRALLCAVVAALAAGCGGDDRPVAEATPSPTPTAASTQTPTPAPTVGEDCPANLDAEPKRKPPSYMAVLSYSHLYRAEGRRFYAVLDGTPDELPSRRDDAQNELVQNWGFSSLETGEHDGKATAHLEGDGHAVDVQVVSLCEGKLQIRYTVR